MYEIPNPTLPFVSVFESFADIIGRLTKSGAAYKLKAADVHAYLRDAFTARDAGPLSTGFDAPVALNRLTRSAAEPLMAIQAQSEGITVTWAKHQDEVRAAQHLRYQVFVQEMGAHIPTTWSDPAHDIDLFDSFCEHLIVRDNATAMVVGTYRLLTPVQAKRAGSFYMDTEFDLVRLRGIRANMIELGRSCVHPDFRSGNVIMALWSALYGFMTRNRFDTMIGCASVPLKCGMSNAAALWQRLSLDHLAPLDMRVTPRWALPMDLSESPLKIETPPLVKGYVRIGSKILGAPAWDREFNCADIPMMLSLCDMPARYKKHFEAQY